MAEGTIKRLTDRGFGFIDTGGGKNLFFHFIGPPGRRFRATAGGPEGLLHGRPGGRKASAPRTSSWYSSAVTVRIAQAEFDQHHPDVAVGSSRGGGRCILVFPQLATIMAAGNPPCHGNRGTESLVFTPEGE